MNQSRVAAAAAAGVVVAIGISALGVVALRSRAGSASGGIVSQAGSRSSARGSSSTGTEVAPSVVPTPDSSGTGTQAVSLDGGGPVEPGCIYPSHSTFHLRTRPVFNSAGAIEVTTRPRIEVFAASAMRRGPERMFHVRFLDGTAREGWMFIPVFELGPACSSLTGVDPADASGVAGLSRIDRDLMECDLYVAEVRRRRAVGVALQRAGSPRFEGYAEAFERWLGRQETHGFGPAMAHLNSVVERWQDEENDTGRSTIRSRAQLMREVSGRCQP